MVFSVVFDRVMGQGFCKGHSARGLSESVRLAMKGVGFLYDESQKIEPLLGSSS